MATNRLLAQFLSQGEERVGLDAAALSDLLAYLQTIGARRQ